MVYAKCVNLVKLVILDIIYFKFIRYQLDLLHEVNCFFIFPGPSHLQAVVDILYLNNNEVRVSSEPCEKILAKIHPISLLYYAEYPKPRFRVLEVLCRNGDLEKAC